MLKLRISAGVFPDVNETNMKRARVPIHLAPELQNSSDVSLTLCLYNINTDSVGIISVMPGGVPMVVGVDI